MSENYIALYYPYIHFRDDAWLKASALYWDKINRIVPSQMIGQTDDSETVELFKHKDVDIIDDIPPTEKYTLSLGNMFETVIRNNESRLLAEFDVRKIDEWKIENEPSRAEHNVKNPSNIDRRLSYIQTGKMEWSTQDYLVKNNFALFFKRFEFGEDWLGMHPRLASVYMTALTKLVSIQNKMHPLAENEREHAAITEVTVDGIAKILLSDPQKQNQWFNNLSQAELKAHYVDLAFEAILPANIEEIDAEKILKLREGEYGKAFRAFQNKINELTTPEKVKELQEITIREALESHISATVRNELRGPYETMRSEIGTKVTEKTIPMVLNVLIQIGTTTASGGLAVASSLLNFIPKIREEKEKEREKYLNSPAAFMMFVDEKLNPATTSEKIKRWLRRGTIGI